MCEVKLIRVMLTLIDSMEPEQTQCFKPAFILNQNESIWDICTFDLTLYSQSIQYVQGDLQTRWFVYQLIECSLVYYCYGCYVHGHSQWLVGPEPSRQFNCPRITQVYSFPVPVAQVKSSFSEPSALSASAVSAKAKELLSIPVFKQSAQSDEKWAQQ